MKTQLLKLNPVQFCKETNACADGEYFAAKHKTMAEVWDNCPKVEWLTWILDAIDAPHDEKAMRLFVCWCVRNTPLEDGRKVWDLLTDDRSRNAVAVAERFANSEATGSELHAAWAVAWAVAGAVSGAAARAAARDAAGAAARDAAGAAAWAAAGAAGAAAWAAAGAAGAAARDAAGVAGAAARDAAGAAARAAAGAVAGAAARDAAWAAARAAQVRELRRVVPNPFLHWDPTP
jgi:hypothetical protein